MLTRMEAQALSQPSMLPRLAYSLAEIAMSTGLSRRSLYRLMAAGQLATVRRGRRRLVPAAEALRLASLTDSKVMLPGTSASGDSSNPTNCDPEEK